MHPMHLDACHLRSAPLLAPTLAHVRPTALTVTVSHDLAMARPSETITVAVD